MRTRAIYIWLITLGWAVMLFGCGADPGVVPGNLPVTPPHPAPDTGDAAPPADATAPPPDSTAPPADAAAGPSDSTLPPADATAGSSDSTMPPADAATPPTAPGEAATKPPIAAPTPEAPPAGPVQFTTLESGTYSGLVTPIALLVKDADQWQTLWNEVHARVQPAPPAPAIDFSQNAIILVGMGEKASGGYSIRISEIAVVDGKLAVQTAVTRPGPGAVVTMALTQPYHIVAVPAVVGRLPLQIAPDALG